MTATEHHLPYFELSPVQFEELCFWLLEARLHTETEHLGVASSRGHGVVARGR